MQKPFRDQERSAGGETDADRVAGPHVDGEGLGAAAQTQFGEVGCVLKIVDTALPGILG